MPKYRVTSPDGQTFEITAPDGASMEEVQAYAMQNMTSKQSADTTPSLDTQANQESWGSAGLIGAGKALTRIGQGMQQGFYNLTGNEKALADLDKQVQEEDRLYKPLSDAHPVATAVGEAMPSMAIPGGAGVKTMLAAGAVPGLLEYGTTGERLGKGALGAAGAGIGVGTVKAAGRLAKPFSKVDDVARDELVGIMKQNDIPLSVANETGNRSLKWIDSALDNLPWVADKQLASKQAQREAYNRAVSRTFGDDSANLTPDVMNNARNKLGAKFQELSERNRLNFTDKQLQDVARIKFDLQRYGTDQNQRIVSNYLDDLLSKVEPDGTISGRAYKEFDSSLGRRIRGTSDGDLRSYLGEVRDMVRNAMDDSISPEDQAAWRTLRKKYANLQMVADAAKNSPTGEVSPARLLQRINSQSKSAKFTGGGELGDLARAGKEILTPLPDSGTAQRAHWMRLLGEGGLGLGALSGVMTPVTAASLAAGATVPLGVQKAMWGGPGSNYLAKGLIDIAPEVEQLLLRAGQGGGVSLSRSLEQ